MYKFLHFFFSLNFVLSKATQTCGNTLEDLIHSLETRQSEGHENDVQSKSEESPLDVKDINIDITASCPVTKESSLHPSSVDACEDEDTALYDGMDATASHISEGLRKRNV